MLRGSQHYNKKEKLSLQHTLSFSPTVANARLHPLSVIIG
jgi:hypothetical protein